MCDSPVLCAGDVQEVENREEVEAAEAAQENADREAFDHA